MMWDETSLLHRGYLYAEQLAAVSRRSQQQAVKNLHAVTSTLKQQVANHKYVDKVASYSPNFRASQKSWTKEVRAAGGAESSERVSLSHGGARSHVRESRMGGLRGSGGGDVYLPGVSTFQAPAPLKNLLKEHTQLKSHQTKKWLK